MLPRMKETETEFWRANYWDAVAARDCAMDGVFYYAVHLHRHLLPAILPLQTSTPRKRSLLSRARSGRTGGIPALQALQT